jgi:ribonuclease BN (tRNA processing enzyme)
VLRLVVLGCSGGYPGPNRACSAYLVETARSRMWLDAGSGTLSRLFAHCSLADIDAVWLTHLHPDHWTDLPLAIHALAIGETPPQEAIAVYGPKGWASAVGVDLCWKRSGDERLYDERTLHDGLVATVHDVTVRTAAVEHGIEAYGLRIEVEGRSLAYSGDSAPCEALLRIAKNVDLFLCAAGTMTSSTIHPNPRQAGELATAAGARHLVLTHLPPGSDGAKALALAASAYAGPLSLAVEGAQFELR